MQSDEVLVLRSTVAIYVLSLFQISPQKTLENPVSVPRKRSRH
jgi:hypothetical protein